MQRKIIALLIIFAIFATSTVTVMAKDDNSAQNDACKNGNLCDSLNTLINLIKKGELKGPQGLQGLKGDKGDQGDPGPMPHFGDWKLESSGCYLAETDGFVVARFYSDAGNDISGVETPDSSCTYSVTDLKVFIVSEKSVSFTMPVKRGHYWFVRWDPRGGSNTDSQVLWLPLSS